MTSLDMNTLLSSSALVGLATLSVYAGSVGSYSARVETKCLPTTTIREATPLRNGVSLQTRHALVGVAVVMLSVPVYLFIGPDPMTKLIRFMYCIVSVNSLCWTSASLTRFLLGTERYQRIPRIRLVLDETRLFLDLEYHSTRSDPPTMSTLQGIRLTTVVYSLISLAASISHMFSDSKSIYMSNLLMLSLAHVDMSLVKPSRFRTVCIFLALTPMLFSWPALSLGYGTLAVSETPNLNNPSQLLIPTTLSRPTPVMILSALDIIFPGKLVAFAYRLDAHLLDQGKRGPVTYFGTTLVAYAVALSIAIGTMYTFGIAQLASLYISPICFLAFVGAALLRSEWTYVWGWKEGVEEDVSGVEIGKGGEDKRFG
ncbi:signal peptide peptidase [Rhizoctonia solani AG-3 Rhs1AP]|uniref:Signal peptide peptidase n=1 Tax=Rhizoctonia solani AG-3 Rhs1AP TaxID=1086054 RepID=X8J0B2_9AGAM|nr:signal peptide peptidase [Rhizoctonia solani AG-3 Rhs1AP]